MPAKTDTHREWARLGARARLIEIENERAAILRAYPDLLRQSGPSPITAGRAKRKLSAAAKRRMSAGMRKYWAKRKAKLGQRSA